MRIAHFTLMNNSGLHHMAQDISAAECKLGHESFLISTQNGIELEELDADVVVLHSHIPDNLLLTGKIKKLVYVAHGTPEHCFQSAVEAGLNQGYGAGDAWMMLMKYLQIADATVTWWPRHQKILKSLCDKHTRVEIVPMGVDTDKFKPTLSMGKWAGNPSVLTAENCHYIKWPLDLMFLWPWVVEEIPGAVCHFQYLPRDQHRWFMPLAMRNGCAYKSYITGNALTHEGLINAFCSTDFYIGLVRYGDFDRIAMEAKACGAKLISYRGNEYADYWITEGDQREMAKELVAILKGEVEPRKVTPANDISMTAHAMVNLYESL